MKSRQENAQIWLIDINQVPLYYLHHNFVYCIEIKIVIA